MQHVRNFRKHTAALKRAETAMARKLPNAIRQELQESAEKVSSTLRENEFQFH
jgi:hypothetical protein